MTPEKLIKLTTTLTLVAAFLLFTSKVAVWYFTGSVSLMAAAVDNIGDFLASLVAFVAARYALRPADEEFTWGYTKAEPLASLALGTFVSGAAFFLIIESVSKIGAVSHVIVAPGAVVAVMVFSIVLTGALVLLQRWAADRTDSTIIHADSIHYKMDFLLNIAVIVTMFLQQFWSGFDPLFGLVIAVYIIWHTWGHIVKPAMGQLMDAELSDGDKKKIINIVEKYNDVLGHHDLRTRRSGRARFIQIHLEMDETMTLFEAHETSDSIMAEIEQEFHMAEVMVHTDPVGPRWDALGREGPP